MRHFDLNGINCTTGELLSAPLDVDALYQLATGDESRKAVLKSDHYGHLRSRVTRNSKKKTYYNVAAHIDPNRLDQTGWGVILPTNAPAELIEALRPLLDLRRSQVVDPVDRKVPYFACFTGDRGYHPEDDKAKFLKRLNRAVGQPADPAKGVPYYLLIVGSPREISWDFQYDLDVEYAVGRICFEKDGGQHDFEAYHRYASDVARAESQDAVSERRAVFFATRHDPATEYSSGKLVKPLVDQLGQSPANEKWKFESLLGDAATKKQLRQLLGGQQTPAILFTASHGGVFQPTDERYPTHQGALLCQDAAPLIGQGMVGSESYFSAADLSATANLRGLISFHFACCGAGTPCVNDFPNPKTMEFMNNVLAPIPFMSHLPMKMLSHPNGGSLAFVGHVDRAWSCSFMLGASQEQVGTFSSCLQRLLNGSRLGHAVEYFNERYASLAVQLTSSLNRLRAKLVKEIDVFKGDLVAIWLEHNDARNYTILGDPAVRVVVKDCGDK